MRAVSQRVNAERLVLFGWSRAILLQLAHPLIAAGVAEHSQVRKGAWTAARRLHSTVRAMTRLTFGTPAEHAGAIAAILAIHRRVNGRLREPVGPWPAGTPYSAEDPALVLWVHATLLDSLPLAFEHLVAPLSPADHDAYCRESAVVACELGASPADVPRCRADLAAYMADVRGRGHLAIGADARLLAATVLSPPFAPLVAPARRGNRLLTTAWLPDDVRRAYGLRWTAADERASRRWMRVLRTARAVTPRRLREWPEARLP